MKLKLLMELKNMDILQVITFILPFDSFCEILKMDDISMFLEI